MFPNNLLCPKKGFSWWRLPGCKIRDSAARKTRVRLTEDTPLELKLQVLEGETEIRVDRATVRSVESFFTGLSFAHLAGAEKKRLRSFLVQLMTSKSKNLTCLENPF